MSFSPFGLQEISVLFELTVGHLRYCLTDVPPQSNSPPDCVLHKACLDTSQGLNLRTEIRLLLHGVSKMAKRAVVLQRRVSSHLGYISKVISQSRTRVKLNRVFFPRCLCKARSLCCGFTSAIVGTGGTSLIHSCTSLTEERKKKKKNLIFFIII